jgi:F-type H+-transporting ATPase subunit alpha
MEAFAQFASDLDAATRAQLDRGARLVELLKQGQYAPLPVERQIVIIYAGTNGFVDSIPTSSLRQFEKELFAHIDEKHADVFKSIREKKEITFDVKAKLDELLKKFVSNFVPSKA